MKKIKPEALPYQYRLIFSKKSNQINKTWEANIRLETIQEFINFQYELLVEEAANQFEIKLKILGINTPKLLIPGNGPAVFEKSYPQLSGEYRIEIANMDGIKNIFKIKISKDKIRLLKNLQKSFVDFIIE